MPDPNMPDHLIEDLRRENTQLRRENERLLYENLQHNDRLKSILEHVVQINSALAKAASENYALSQELQNIRKQRNGMGSLRTG